MSKDKNKLAIFKKILGVLAYFTIFEKTKLVRSGISYVITQMKVLSHRWANTIFIAVG